MTATNQKILALHLGLIALLLVLHFTLPAYHHVSLARIMVLAVYALGFNLLFGYTGLLSLGHALFFAAGLYGAGLSMQPSVVLRNISKTAPLKKPSLLAACRCLFLMQPCQL